MIEEILLKKTNALLDGVDPNSCKWIYEVKGTSNCSIENQKERLEIKRFFF